MQAEQQSRSRSSSTASQRSGQFGQSSFSRQQTKKKANQSKGRHSIEEDEITGITSAQVAEATETVQRGKGKETTEIPSAQAAEENDFSQFHRIWDENLDAIIPEYWKELNLSGVDSHIFELPREHKIFKLIESTMNKGIQEMPYTAPKQEKTRMAHTQSILNEPNLTETQKSKAKLRLKEGEKGGAARVTSGEIEILHISVIYNKKLWNNYIECTKGIHKKLENANDTEPLRKVRWSTTSPPVIDGSIGEVLLFHGTEPSIIDKIGEGGFRPDLGRNKGTTEKPEFGLLGQGTYLSDNMSKVMTYATGPECRDYQCESEEEGSQVIAARTVLGHPKKMRGMLQPGGNLRDQSHDSPLKPGRQSVFSEGFQVSRNPFSAGSGTNEFLIKKSEQAYPELRITYRRKRN